MIPRSSAAGRIHFFKDFKGQIVVDLGAGSASSDYEIVMASEAKGYVGVEPHFGRSLSHWISLYLDHRNDKRNRKAIPAAVAETDALTFLRRLPDKSVSIFSSGTGAEVMIEDYDYIDEVSKEIERVLHPQGAFIGYSTSFHLNRKGFEYERLNEKAKEFRPHFFSFEIYKHKPEHN